MAKKTYQRDKVRVQVDLSQAEALMLELLQKRLSARSRADLLQQAYGSFLWLVDEMLSGRHIVSVEAEELTQLNKYKELCVPAVEPMRFDHFQYLVQRPETGRQQAYLKGQNMTVGQLIYKMRANELNAEEAANDMALPLRQVMEAQVYYQANQELIESEAADEKQRLIAQGVPVEPSDIP